MWLMSRKYQKYSVEFREQAVRLVVDGPRPVIDVAKEISVNEGTLSNWVRLFKGAHPVVEQPLSVSERAQLKALQAEVRELRMKTEFLGKAAAFFAQEYR
jgi:transposase